LPAAFVFHCPCMRLVTRPDLDGLTCAVLLSRCERIDSIALVQPQEIADRLVEVGADDVLTNVPFHPGCGLWFDNHLLTDARSTPPAGFRGRYAQAPSAARVVYDHYAPQHPELSAYAALLADTDRLDSADLSREDVLSPEGYILIGFTLDARTGLDGLHDYFLVLYPAVRDRSLADVLALPAVVERVTRLREQDHTFRDTALGRSRMQGRVVVTDFRGMDPLPVGNRFLIYTLFPAARVSLRLQGTRDGRVSISAGRSIFDRSSRANLGVLMSLHGGGGHAGAAACVVRADEADRHLAEIVAALERNA
jgi:hypothetical protein